MPLRVIILSGFADDVEYKSNILLRTIDETKVSVRSISMQEATNANSYKHSVSLLLVLHCIDDPDCIEYMMSLNK